MQTIDLEQREEIYSVSRLNNEVRFLLEDSFPLVWVEGEISNFAAPNSGHWYFSLKDASAQVRCAMFRGSARKLTFTPKDGMHVLIKARVSLYENRGEFQLIAEDMEERGEGKLRRAFEVLKKKLETAGLFDPAHKKSFPVFPKQIGVITSATGAAIRDILTVLKRRHASVPVIIYPTLVQGETAAPAIVKAIQTANQRKECDVIILARGGGSLEDLWPFNEEIVAHAIYKSELPIISGVGHEVDFTIADFVADKRAPTPSAAAEMVTPDCTELLQLVARQKQQLLRCLRQTLIAVKQRLDWMQKHLAQQHPRRRLAEQMQRLDFCELSFVKLQHQLISQLQSRIKDLDFKLHRQLPTHRISAFRNQVELFHRQCNALMAAQMTKQHTALAQAAAKLDALSPLATLKRGYAIALNEEQKILRSASDAQAGEPITVRLLHGELACRVEKVKA
ncbi:exodeoxyribonuclease VII large subunit [Aquicella lusitana]|uniref:Exodeoxyribonuclease 7 large subunit n=1 Tax=Aquicella lusitana TaxID=254246 RepID=A0A370GNF9_9COXI|nr:exodeoxyribonuclease VII large subunit [Aquicella lusitana]RDI44816.1 exodeoxyribonuclease VII large subunit [Aquicella lusitana]VVC73013.1 Exodeoxyribonuclease 7 large subunit [Aquicella lusitana]